MSTSILYSTQEGCPEGGCFVSTNGGTATNATNSRSISPSKSAATIPPNPTETDTLLVAADVPSDSRPTDVGSGDTRTVLITIGCVGGIAVLVLFVYWVTLHFATRRRSRKRSVNVEEGTQSPTPMRAADLQSPLLLPPMLLRAANVQSPLLPPVSAPHHSTLVPGVKKAVTQERQSRIPYSFYISDSLAKRCSSIHPGTKVFFGNASRLKEVPSRKPVPESFSRHTAPSRPATEHTESLWSDEGDDDASTVLGDNGRPQRRATTDVFRPLPPGRTISSWLGGGGNKGSSSAKPRPGPTDN